MAREGLFDDCGYSGFEECSRFEECSKEAYEDGYNKALEYLQERIDEEYYDGGYGDYHEVAMIVRMIEKMKDSK